jgi:2-polyprenyl-6-methoxyphenol hydroxylase-like FAD-dependent oxidoreductase
MYKTSHIAIIGGGPAGLTAAAILHRHGHAVRVYDSDPSRGHRAQGGTLDLHEDKAQIALQRAGLLDAFRAVARHEDQENKNVDPISGEVQPDEAREDDALDRPEIDRGALRDLLLSALPEGTLMWGHRLKGVEPALGGCHALHFADGNIATADLVIGADGAWSRVRAALSPEVPFYTGVTFLEGWIENPTARQAGLVGNGTLFSFGGPQAIFAQRNGQGRICVYAAVKRAQDRLKQQLAATSAKHVVQGIYAGWAGNLVDLLEGCADFVERPIFSLTADFHWAARPGVTLIGDAAHVMPPVGLGVNLAMLDASDIASAVVENADWHTATCIAEGHIMDRARRAMKDAIPGFAAWFEEND